MKKLEKYLLLLGLLIIPKIIFAVEITQEKMEYLPCALIVEIILTTLISQAILKPLSKLISIFERKKIFRLLFYIRLILIIILYIVLPINKLSRALIIEIVLFLVFTIIILPILNKIKSIKNKKLEESLPKIYKCPNCLNEIEKNNKFCTNCGQKLSENNIVSIPLKYQIKNNIDNINNYKEVYKLNENKMLEIIINKELEKIGVSTEPNVTPNELIQTGFDDYGNMLPKDILKRKKILNILFSLFISIFITLIFFHFPIYTYIIGIILLIIFYKKIRKFDFNKYLQKQLKTRPKEKISNIIMNEKNNLVLDTSKKVLPISLIIFIILPLIIFSKPRIIYENTENGYAVRYYIFGLTNFKTATIPETYKNKKVVSLRGNTFSNMPFLKEITLPNTIKEIRGQAFNNCLKLESVNIPENLEYLGGGAFKNAKSIKNIELPDTITFIGGEAFKNATSLESIKLSSNISEIRGETFENCTSLKSITIPDNVERIGGHAFYNNKSLTEVNISENSKLTEIGSSAFRLCENLYNIRIPSNTTVNERAFKESPTNIQRFN